jgi:hypothetical protein
MCADEVLRKTAAKLLLDDGEDDPAVLIALVDYQGLSVEEAVLALRAAKADRP